MDTPPTKYRPLKRYLRDRLMAEDFSGALSAALDLPARKVVNPLISFFCDHDVVLRWRSVSALGVVVAHLADEDRESARVVMRRLMWSLNDESGGIGWGAPEAMGEITARHEGLAGEFALRVLALPDPPVSWEACLQDQGRLQFYVEGILHDCTVAQLAGGILPVGDPAFR